MPTHLSENGYKPKVKRKKKKKAGEGIEKRELLYAVGRNVN
jgi:hypothetical protein